MADVDKVPGTPVREGDAPVRGGTRSQPAKDGRLPVSEVAYDRPGGPSPFGDDIEFPLPVEELRYTHTTTP